MKLAEALVLRADAQKRILYLRQRLTRIARIQEGDVPAEDPQVLLTQLETAAADLVRLIKSINVTNATARMGNGQTLTDALAERDVLKLRFDSYRELADAATVSQERYSRSEVKFVSTVPVKEMQEMADKLAREYRDLDARIQETNWQTTLME